MEQETNAREMSSKNTSRQQQILARRCRFPRVSRESISRVAWKQSVNWRLASVLTFAYNTALHSTQPPIFSGDAFEESDSGVIQRLSWRYRDDFGEIKCNRGNRNEIAKTEHCRNQLGRDRVQVPGASAL